MMNWQKSRTICDLDTGLSALSPTRRILYIKSETRDIIPRALDYSVVLWSRLNLLADDLGMQSPLPAVQPGERFQYLIQQRLCMDLSEIYETLGGPGRIRANGLNSQPYEAFAQARVFYIKDFHAFHKDTRAFLIKTFLDAPWARHSILLISSPYVYIPDGFHDVIDVIHNRLIGREDVARWLRDEVRAEENNRRIPEDKRIPEADLEDYALQFVGLTEGQIENVLYTLSNMQSLHSLLGSKTMYDLIRQAKMAAIEKEPCIRLIPTDHMGKTAAGLDYYTSEWLDDRIEDFRHPEQAARNGTPAPKGVLLVGVPGTGKTLMARETARRLGPKPGQALPLIRFDISRLQSKDFGTSEANLNRFLDQIGAYAPAVMLVDEIEKTFHSNAQGEGMHEVKTQMLGTLLDWLQGRKDNIFTFITANNISSVPPELLRDERLSGRFFSFMPSRDELTAILCLKLNGYRHLFTKDFGALLQSVVDEEKPAPTVACVFDDIARAAQDATPPRHPFMTGANLTALIELTFRGLRKDRKNPPFNQDTFLKKFLECACDRRFVPQGQSNLKDIAALWLRAQANQYANVSQTDILPTWAFSEGRFVGLVKPENAYDQYMQQVIRQEIERQQRALENDVKARERIAAQGQSRPE